MVTRPGWGASRPACALLILSSPSPSSAADFGGEELSSNHVAAGPPACPRPSAEAAGTASSPDSRFQSLKPLA